MTFEDFKKKFKSDPEFMQEKTGNFVDMLEFLEYVPTIGMTPKQYAKIILEKSKDEINSRQVKDRLKSAIKANRTFYKENKDNITKLTKEIKEDVACLVKQ